MDDFGTSPARPHHGVYGIIGRGSRWLMIDKARGPYVGRLDLPGGTPEPEESRVETLIREVREETGVVVDAAHFLGEVTLTFGYRTTGGAAISHHHAVFFAISEYDVASIQKDRCEREDAQGVLWANPNALAEHRKSPLISAAIKLLRCSRQGETFK